MTSGKACVEEEDNEGIVTLRFMYVGMGVQIEDGVIYDVNETLVQKTLSPIEKQQ